MADEPGFDPEWKVMARWCRDAAQYPPETVAKVWPSTLRTLDQAARRILDLQERFLALEERILALEREATGYQG